MSRRFRYVSLFGTLIAPIPLAGQDTAHVVIVATTDVHGHATHWDYLNDREGPWGLSRVATVVDSLRRAYPDRVIVVDNGDLIQGNLFATYFATEQSVTVHPVLDAMNAIGYDAAVPGNHEFNFGLDVLARAHRAAAFPIVSANIYRLPRDTLAYQPYVIVRRGDVRVGIMGLTTPGVMVWDRDNVAGRVIVRRILPEAASMLRRLREAGADLTVVAIHSGLSGESSYDTTGVGAENVAARLAELPVRPDLVIVGHSHRQIRDSLIGGVHFIQPLPWARGVAVAHVWLVREAVGGRRDGYRVVRITADQIPLAGVPPSPQVERRLAQAHLEVRTWVGTPLGSVEGDWSARFARVEDTPLIDFINEVQRRTSGAQLSATAAFNTAGGLGPGPVRLRDVAGIYPYENTLKAVRIDGERLEAYLERSASYFRGAGSRAPINDSIPGYNYDIVSGVRYVIDLRRPVGSRIRQLTYRGRLVTPNDTFTLALNNYRQGGGGGFEMLVGLPVVYDAGENIRDLVVSAIRDAETLRADEYFEDSWRIIPESVRNRIRTVLAEPRAPARDSTVLRVLAINDFHGALQPATPSWADGRQVGGASALAGWLDSLSGTCRCVSLRVHAGDEWQGTPISNFVFGRSVTEVFNLMALDAAAIGNHEFDWTVDTLRARFAESAYPWLAANVMFRSGRGTPDWAIPWTLVERGGLRIALIGTITESTPTSTNPINVTELVFPNGATAIERYLPAVRAAAPDFVIVLTHSGGYCDSTCRGEVFDLANGLDSAAVDLIVSGHTHTELNTSVNGIPIVQARAHGTNLAVVDFIWRADGGREVQARIETVWTDAVRPDSVVAAVVARYAEQTRRVVSRPVARMLFALSRRRNEEYALGNLVADALRNAARTDVGLINNGGIRADLPGGRITFGDLYKVQPFGNAVVRLSVTGAVLIEAIEHSLRRGQIEAHISGVTVRYDLSRDAGDRVRDVRFADGRKLKDDEHYTLAVPDFLAVGGNGYAMLRDRPVEHIGLVDVEALVQYLRRLPQPVEVSSRPRFVARR